MCFFSMCFSGVFLVPPGCLLVASRASPGCLWMSPCGLVACSRYLLAVLWVLISVAILAQAVSGLVLPLGGAFQIRFGLEVKLEVQIGVEGMSTQMNNILLTNI